MDDDTFTGMPSAPSTDDAAEPAYEPHSELLVAPRRSRWRVPLIIGAVLVAVLAAAVGVDLAVSAGRIHPGVTVGQTAVGGMRVPEATVAIADAVGARIAAPVTLNVDGAGWELDATALDVSIDATGHAEAAFAVGRGDFVPAVADRVTAIIGGVMLPVELDADDESLAALAANVDEAVGTPPVDAGVIVRGAEAFPTAPESGFGIDREAMRTALLAAFLSEDGRDVTLELVSVEPAIGTEEAEQALADASAMLSGPLDLYYEDEDWTVEAEAIGGWIAFRSVETSEGALLEAYLDPVKVAEGVMPMVEDVGRPAVDATFLVSGSTVSVVPAVDGLGVDADGLAVSLRTVLTSADPRRAELPMRPVEAERSTAEAEAMGIVERIATFTTNYTASNKPRNNNIHVLARDLDGLLIAPGDTFDLNAAAGPSTPEKGYVPAGAIVNGVIVPELGGGICQVATTMFNTIFFSGLPVVERHAHSLYLSNYPTGRDAAISIGGKNLRFTNDTEHWILIDTSYTDSSITISFFGTDPGYEVSYETGPWTNITSPPVKEIMDSTLALGSRVVQTPGQSGRTVVVIRTVKQDGAVIRTDTFKSVYRSTEEIVRVGTKPPTPAPSEPTTSS